MKRSQPLYAANRGKGCCFLMLGGTYVSPLLVGVLHISQEILKSRVNALVRDGKASKLDFDW
jgi:hypothetical protein